MISIDKDFIGPWIAKHCNMVWTPDNSATIGLIKQGELVAGVWYEDYNKVSIMCHIAIVGRMTAEYLNIIFDYPFVQLGVRKIVVPVSSNNEASIKFVKNLGFEEEARLLDVSPDGDMIFFVMSKDKCRFIGERYGKKRTSRPSST